MSVDLKQISELREKTGVSIMKCKEALKAADGDMEKAILELRKQGEASAAKKSDRTAKEGVVASYIHHNGKIGAMVKLYCETDFVARNEDFLALGNDIAMQIAASDPKYLDPEQIPEDDLKQEEEVLRQAFKKENKHEEVIEKIIQGKLKKHKEENSLLKQPYVKNSEITIEQLLTERVAKLGENIKIGEFIRFEI
ncbi:MAG: elongation factor Ts [Candidatus Moranbacteria bacterium]|nr:elongation factor Ts [Candidatus Moranbacteria bacterium]